MFPTVSGKSIQDDFVDMQSRARSKCEREPVTLTLYVHWVCPQCNQNNAMKLDAGFPISVLCSECGLVASTLNYPLRRDQA
ncbi:MAG: hypothetical protein IT423_10500 [Pirellulaceae bacterium]|nr:hypothetical protein [Pirellulaceae bacterium]